MICSNLDLEIIMFFETFVKCNPYFMLMLKLQCRVFLYIPHNIYIWSKKLSTISFKISITLSAPENECAGEKTSHALSPKKEMVFI